MTVEETIASIKAEMPKTYEAIKERAAVMGPQAYGLVRRGIRGELGCFYARERVRKEGQLDRWLVAGCGTGMPDLVPEQFEQELKIPDLVDLIFELRDPDSARACTQEQASAQ